ncbi:hypothetical protein OIU84_019576 [Salix udensis]|uniref:Uncharacterized protein n=1 Tax=Salix udensis TaxID=889485 RepID=A0AAD6L0Q8_9ROSI|nr:hypothetical protein OIU84_019576 [Salix udensis]
MDYPLPSKLHVLHHTLPPGTYCLEMNALLKKGVVENIQRWATGAATNRKLEEGLWSPEEDEKLVEYITTRDHGSWSSVPKSAGLKRCGKSCRLRWLNYLRPELKRGSFSALEEQVIIDVHRILGNRWAQISKHLPGRTDNEVKNFWNSRLKKKLMAQGLDPKTHNLIPTRQRAANYKFHLIILLIAALISLHSFKQQRPCPCPKSCYDNPSVIWNVNSQNSYDSSLFTCVSSIENSLASSSSSSSANPTGFGLVDENCFWSCSDIVEPFEAAKIFESVPPQDQENQLNKVCDTQIVDKNKGVHDIWKLHSTPLAMILGWSTPHYFLVQCVMILAQWMILHGTFRPPYICVYVPSATVIDSRFC